MAEKIKLLRDVAAIQIPWGIHDQLSRETEVIITQSFGGPFTVVAEGTMYRIENHDADALGKTPTSPTAATSNQERIEDQILAQLRTCYDPEIPVSIVDLGLIYEVKVLPTPSGLKAAIRMTLTAPGCGMGTIIVEEARHKVLSLPTITDVQIELVFDPPWDRTMMSEQARLELGML